MAKRYKLGSSFIGYNKGQVDSYIDSLMESNAMKLDEIRRRVNDCRSELDMLNKSLIDKQKEMDEHKKSRKYMDFALKRVKSTAGLISAYAENERRELDEAGRAKLDEYDREIERLSVEIKNKQEHLNFLKRRASKPKQVKHASADEAAKLPNTIEENKAESPRKVRSFSFWDESSYEENYTVVDAKAEKKELSSAARAQGEFQYGEETKIPSREYSPSQALSADISQVRNKYLVGKIAGENLVAWDGSLIIEKNNIISAETVKRAEEEGKLAELIINMVLPGMEN